MSTLPSNKRIAIIGGGTNTYISNHLALSAPAYGTTAFNLAVEFECHPENKMKVDLYLTKMASKGATDLDTPEDVEALVDRLIADPNTRVIIFNVAMVDFKPKAVFDLFNYEDSALNMTEFGKYKARIESRAIKGKAFIQITPYQKIINKIRKERKDILLVGFKTTCGATKQEQYEKGLKLCKDASANIVFVNDVDKERIKALKECSEYFLRNDDYFNSLKLKIKENTATEYELNIFKPYSEQYLHWENKQRDLQNNGLVTPEESSYWYNTRDEALNALVQMVLDRSHLHFTRSTVVDSETVPWQTSRRVSAKVYTLGNVPPEEIVKGPREIIPNPLIPETFRTVFDWVRSQGAYKQGPTGATVGHFGIALGPNEFLTSKRKTDFNKIEEVGLVRVITDDPDDVFGYKHFFEESNNDKVIAFGAKPSVGGQSQRSLFEAFPNLNCIVHFHCPLKTEYRAEFKTTPQFSFECGSHECIASNITGFKEYKVSPTHSIWAGHMDYHGPNIVFNSEIDPQLVINFIDKYWDLSRKTDGLSLENI